MKNKTNDGVSHELREEVYTLLSRARPVSLTETLHWIDDQSEPQRIAKVVEQNDAPAAPRARLTQIFDLRPMWRALRRIVEPRLVDICDQLKAANVGWGSKIAWQIVGRGAWLVFWSLIKAPLITLKDAVLDLLDDVDSYFDF